MSFWEKVQLCLLLCLTKITIWFVIFSRRNIGQLAILTIRKWCFFLIATVQYSRRLRGKINFHLEGDLNLRSALNAFLKKTLGLRLIVFKELVYKKVTAMVLILPSVKYFLYLIIIPVVKKKILKITSILNKLKCGKYWIATLQYIHFKYLRDYSFFNVFLDAHKHCSRNRRKYWIVPANHRFIFCVWLKYLYFKSILNTKNNKC